MTDIPGIDTIQNLVGEPPAEIPVSRETMSEQQVLMQDWNASFIAIIPYCYKCRQPLIWHSPPETDELFNCPSCGRIWVKGYDWSGSKRAKILEELDAKGEQL